MGFGALLLQPSAVSIKYSRLCSEKFPDGEHGVHKIWNSMNVFIGEEEFEFFFFWEIMGKRVFFCDFR